MFTVDHGLFVWFVVDVYIWRRRLSGIGAGSTHCDEWCSGVTSLVVFEGNEVRKMNQIKLEQMAYAFFGYSCLASLWALLILRTLRQYLYW